jgi:hypothetical protein
MQFQRRCACYDFRVNGITLFGHGKGIVIQETSNHILRNSRHVVVKIVVWKTRAPHRSNAGLTPSEQKRAGRHEVFATSYETIERNIRPQLAGSLSEGGFDPARDIEAITVNRWAHAYVNNTNPLYDEIYEYREGERYSYIRGRKPFGRTAIASSDAGSSSTLQSAIEQAHRAVHELSHPRHG